MWHADRVQPVDAVVASYVALVEGYDVAYLYPYAGTLTGVVYGQRGELPGELGINGDWMDALGMGDEPPEEVDDEEAFYLAIAERVHASTGIPMLVENVALSLETQFAQLTGARYEPRPWVDAVLAYDDAFVVRRDSDLVGVWDGVETPLGWCTRLGPGVFAGRLPAGAGQVTLDGHPASVNARAWLCVADVTDPVPLYGCAGIEWVLDVPVEDVPRLWPEQAPLDGIGWTVSVSTSPAPRLASEIIGEWMSYSMPGTVLGVPHGFEASRGDSWAAVAECRSFAVTVEGLGRPPERLDLVG
jgi:hypothetical protein